MPSPLLLLAAAAASSAVLVASVFSSRRKTGRDQDGARPQTPQAQPAEPAPGRFRVVDLRPGSPLDAQLRHHAAEAEASHLRPFVEFGAQWCPPSRMFGEVLDDPRMVRALAGVYLIRVDIDALGSDPLVREWGVAVVPLFHELDAAGERTGRSTTGAAWGEDTVENMAAAMARFFA